MFQPFKEIYIFHTAVILNETLNSVDPKYRQKERFSHLRKCIFLIRQSY
jgi:hypothetical protein